MFSVIFEQENQILNLTKLPNESPTKKHTM